MCFSPTDGSSEQVDVHGTDGVVLGGALRITEGLKVIYPGAEVTEGPLLCLRSADAPPPHPRSQPAVFSPSSRIRVR